MLATIGAHRKRHEWRARGRGAWPRFERVLSPDSFLPSVQSEASVGALQVAFAFGRGPQCSGISSLNSMLRVWLLLWPSHQEKETG